MKVTKPRYWVCIIGPVEDTKLPQSADFPPRMAARKAVISITGDDPICDSGWCDEDEYLRIIKARYRTSKNEKNKTKKV